MDGAPNRELARLWRARARTLEAQAEQWRRDGDADYAEELEQAAADNRAAADRLEVGAPA